MGNRIKTGVTYVVKLLPIVVELVEKYRGVDEKKDSPDCVFPVGEYQTMFLSFKIIGKKMQLPYQSYSAYRTLYIRCSGYLQRHTVGNPSESVGT